MTVSPYPPVFMPNPNAERVPGSTPLLPAPYSSPIQAVPGRPANDVTPEQWQAYIDTLKQAYQASSGFERLKLQAQIDDAEKGRQNSLQIAQLQADNSRYGANLQRQTTLDQLRENARQFEANHALDMQKFGLSVGELTGVYNGQPTLAARNAQLQEAQLIAQQRSQPNRLFQTMDLEQALGSLRAGRPATSLARTGVAAIDGLSTDYTGNPYLTGGTSQAAGAAPAGGSGQGPAPDPRIKAIRAVVDALPPSATDGLDPAGVAALNAAFHIYSAPQTIKPGSLETLDPLQRATLQSAGDRLQGVTGRTYDDLLAEYTRNGVGQGSVRAA